VYEFIASSTHWLFCVGLSALLLWDIVRVSDAQGRCCPAVLSGGVWHLAYTIVHWDDIRALMSSRLLALDKCPGACPRGRGGAQKNPWEDNGSGHRDGCAGKMWDRPTLLKDKGRYWRCSAHIVGFVWGKGASFWWMPRYAFNSVNREAALWILPMLLS